MPTAPAAEAPAPQRGHAALPAWAGRLADGAFRVLFSGIFLVAGIGHFREADRMIERLEAAPLAGLATAIAPAPLLISATGAVLVVAGLLLAAGLWTRVAALALIAVLIPITATVHVAAGIDHVGPLFKNVALLGGLIHFAVRGAGGASLDRRR